jgi:hypothetical protein
MSIRNTEFCKYHMIQNRSGQRTGRGPEAALEKLNPAGSDLNIDLLLITQPFTNFNYLYGSRESNVKPKMK